MTDKEPDLVFEDPPRKRGAYDWDAISTRLRKRPGKWARVFATDRISIVQAVRTGSINAVNPRRGFEVKTANNDKSGTPPTCSMWMRYVPEKDDMKGGS